MAKGRPCKRRQRVLAAGHALHIHNTDARFAHGTRFALGHRDALCTWAQARFARGHVCAAAVTAESDAGYRDVALATGPGKRIPQRRGTTTPSAHGRLRRTRGPDSDRPAQRPARSPRPCPRRRESQGLGAGGAWRRAAWSPGQPTAASWATWVRAGRPAGRRLGVWVQGTRV